MVVFEIWAGEVKVGGAFIQAGVFIRRNTVLHVPVARNTNYTQFVGISAIARNLASQLQLQNA